jgi:hypothetical protein
MKKIFSTIGLFDELIKKCPAFFALIFNAIVFTLMLSFFDVFYMGNDDVGMVLYLKGVGTVENSSPNILFINIIFSYIICQLYRIFDFIDWYPFSFLAITYFSYAYISYLIFKHASGIYIKLLYIAIYSSIFLFPIILLQFTIVAGIAAIAGVCGLLITEENKIRVLALLLITISALVRFQSCMLVVVMFAPIYAYKIVSLKNLQNIVKNSMWVKYLLLSIALNFGLDYFNILYYNNYDKTIQFYSFNSARGEILDKEALESFSEIERKSILDRVGWTENDYQMFIHWFFMNQEIYHTKVFEELVKFRPSRNLRSFIKYTFNEKTTEGIKDIIKLPIIIHLFLALFATSICYFSFEKLLFASIVYIWFFIIYLLIGFFFRTPPERVFIVMTCATAISFFTIPIINPSKEILAAISSNFIKLLLVLIGLYPIQKILRDNRYTMLHSWTQYENSNYQREALQSAIENLKSRLNVKLLISWGAAFPADYIKPFEDISYLKRIHIFSLGTHQLTPEARAVLRKLSISDLYMAIAERPDVYLLIGRHYNFMEMKWYETYMIEHYGKQIQWQEIDSPFNQLNGSKLFKASFTSTNLSESTDKKP